MQHRTSRFSVIRGSLAAMALLVATGLASQALAAPPPAPKEAPAKSDEAPAAEGVVNINSATAEQLTWLPRIGPARADQILAYRAKHPFAQVAQLARVKGIGLKTVQMLRPWLTIKGDTTLRGPLGSKKRSAKKKVEEDDAMTP